ncbi:MAG: ABC transporter permease subunit [Armatimonadota bacterium]|nr:ABC transporter permease subunit [Armatimonadota bacterium]MDR7466756.1 ABC transporter permease subunit [Armatimonadota bacterium]MDR7492770.1 ABC transporter permease subunit [Armatimonadota bacterium]MDR7498546.1 ABC transporter permease subunit [Armatimonadota bacterium]MDR7504325.1 ABC transporter permease subunit [Armatimonadota bacterium]
MKRWRLVAAALAATLLLAPGTAQVGPVRPAITRDEGWLNPYTYQSGYPGWNLMTLVFDPLFYPDNNNEPIPWLLLATLAGIVWGLAAVWRRGRRFDIASLGHHALRDAHSELIYGIRISMTIGFLAAAAAISIGTVVGVVAGYFSGWADAVLMRLVDVVLVIPFLPLMILLAAYLGPSLWNIVLVIGALVWARPARVLRAQVLSLRALEFVDAARALGASSGRILRRHILPGVLSLALAQFIWPRAGRSSSKPRCPFSAWAIRPRNPGAPRCTTRRCAAPSWAGPGSGGSSRPGSSSPWPCWALPLPGSRSRES